VRLVAGRERVLGRAQRVFVADLSPAVVDDGFTTAEVLDDLLGARCSASLCVS